MTEHSTTIHPASIIPFGILLAMIALGPVLFQHWWHKHYPKVAIGLGFVTLAYYGLGLHAVEQIGHTAHEYLSFIALIGSLFIVAGGIHIHLDARSSPWFNTGFLLAGAILANVLGTTGASMLLIRPWIRLNKSRIAPYQIVFFIFIISNIGGCLSPIGDPPLFLGYLMGIPFWWVLENCWAIWALGVGLLLAIFFAIDLRSFQKAKSGLAPDSQDQKNSPTRIEGLGNVFFLALILGSIFIDKPHFLREGLMIAAAVGSYLTTRKSVHEANQFDFAPIQEVAILFIGIFATMMPALDWLQGNASALADVSPAMLYWGSGTLSSALDNAPTYLCFLKAISAHFVNPDTVAAVNHLIQNGGADISSLTGEHAESIRQTFMALRKYHPELLASGQVSTAQIEVACLLGNLSLNKLIVAVSIGAVFFGANTYIANGPNFMVKSMADQQGVKTPDFLTYIWKYTLPILLPVLFIIHWIFFH